jgi:hypothetical protein
MLLFVFYYHPSKRSLISVPGNGNSVLTWGRSFRSLRRELAEETIPIHFTFAPWDFRGRRLPGGAASRWGYCLPNFPVGAEHCHSESNSLEIQSYGDHFLPER